MSSTGWVALIAKGQYQSLGDVNALIIFDRTMDNAVPENYVDLCAETLVIHTRRVHRISRIGRTRTYFRCFL